MRNNPLLRVKRFQRKGPFWVVLIIALIASLLELPLAQDSGLCEVNSVYDGDTMRATCNTEKIKVRLYCIDTPEMKQRPWGVESRDYLRQITPGQVTLVRHDKDRYGRIVGEVFDGQTSLNLEMVRQGQAAVYERYCKDAAYFEAQAGAQQAQRGIWSKPGLHQQPWEWRKSRQ